MNARYAFLIAIAAVLIAVAGFASASSLFSVQGKLKMMQNSNNNNNNKIRATTTTSKRNNHPRHEARFKALEAEFGEARRRFFRPDGTFNRDHVTTHPMPPQPPPAPSNGGGNNSGSGAPFGVNVQAFGAVPDGKTDNTAAFKKAILAGRGGLVLVPAGSYAFDTNAKDGDYGIELPPGTVLQGTNAGPVRSWAFGSTLIVTANPRMPPKPFIRLSIDSAVRGFSIYYPDQTNGTVNPTPYPATIAAGSDGGENLLIENMLIANPWIAIDLTGASRHVVRGIWGQPLYRGIIVDQITDIGRIEMCHLWPFAYPYVPSMMPVHNFVKTTAITFLIMRSDWQIVMDVFSWGYARGMVFAESSMGSCNGQFSDIDFDDVAVGIQIESTQPPALFFSNLNLANAGNKGNANNAMSPTAILTLSNASADSQLIINGLSVWGQWDNAARWGSGAKLQVTDFVIVNWNKAVPAFDITGGRVAIQNGYFSDVIGTAVHVHSSVDRAIVTGNDLVGNPVICEGTDRLCSGNLP